MTYTELMRALFHANYQRVERDDRLLDIFSGESREHGVELWEKWTKDAVWLLSVSMPFNEKKLKLYAISRAELEELLYKNQPAKLSVYKEIATGEPALLEL